MARRVDHVLHDMLRAVGYASEVAQGRNAADFEVDWKFRLTLERALEILSEASRSLPDDLKALHPGFDWTGLRDLGNIVRHRYDSVPGDILLRIVTDELPRLKMALEDLQKRNRDARTG
jgi:uncharacterized protein with HEPN domain